MGKDDDTVFIKGRVPRRLHLDFKKQAIEVQKTQEDIIRELVEEWLKKAGHRTAKELLEAFLSGSRPPDDLIAEVAHSENLSPEKLYEMRDRLFDGADHGFDKNVRHNT